MLNKRYVNTYGAAYWIRGKSEAATGLLVPAGFTFRHLLRGWMNTLGLRNKDLLGLRNKDLLGLRDKDLLSGTIGFELIAADSRVFNEDHVILSNLNPE